MSAHSPEPWIVCINSLDEEITIQQDRMALRDEEPSIIGTVDDMGDGIDRETGLANAARIIACVNACEGMADPAVEISGLRSRSDNIPAMCREVEALRTQKALLLAALKAMIDECREDRENPSQIQAFEQARAALLAAKGGK